MIVGGIFDVFIMVPNVSIMNPIVLISIMGLYSHWYGVCIEVFMAIMAKNFVCLTKQSK